MNSTIQSNPLDSISQITLDSTIPIYRKVMTSFSHVEERENSISHT